jgi:hypothetical protein
MATKTQDFLKGLFDQVEDTIKIANDKPAWESDVDDSSSPADSDADPSGSSTSDSEISILDSSDEISSISDGEIAYQKQQLARKKLNQDKAGERKNFASPKAKRRKVGGGEIDST